MFLCTLLLNLTIANQQPGTVNNSDGHGSPQTVEKIVTYTSLYNFPWYVIASSGGSSSFGSHAMKFASVGQVSADNAQSVNYKIFSGYISSPAPKPVDVQEEENLRPHSFELFQNYPNPFNPTTSIKFSLLKSGHVILDIYNILGRRVLTLVNEELPAGYKLVTWDGKDNSGNEVASGVYFYKLKAGDFSETKKMILMK
jgi:hypothetical protein